MARRVNGEILSTGTSEGLGDDLMRFDEFNELIGLQQRYADDERYRTG